MEAITALAQSIVDEIGAPRKALEADWIRGLCIWNGFLAALSYLGQLQEKARFPTPTGERKVAAFNVMNGKYVGWLRVTLFLHIFGGMTAQLASSIAIFLEERNATLSQKFARAAAVAEAFVHAPTAFLMSPFVYGDKGVTPYVYGTVSFLLQLSGLTALRESLAENMKNLGKQEQQSTKRIELRRMCTTISIFLYVRLYAVMRGPSGFLQRQKYSMAVMTAGTAMMPLGWARGVFPFVFWCLMAVNRRVASMTMRNIRRYGVDGAAERMVALA